MDNGGSAGLGFVILFVIAALLGLIPAAIARSKGREFALWWIYGTVIFIVAFIHSLCIRSTREAVDKRAAASGLARCPECAEMIRPEAKKCRYCGADLTKSPAA